MKGKILLWNRNQAFKKIDSKKEKFWVGYEVYTKPERIKTLRVLEWIHIWVFEGSESDFEKLRRQKESGEKADQSPAKW
jgi:hypothetical protein